MQAWTSGKLRSNAKNNSYTPEFGRGRAISHLKTSFHNIEMPMSPCKPVLNMCSTNSQINIQGLDSCLRRFNALIQDSKLPWQASRLTMALNNFEATAAHLLPYDPVAKKRSGGQKRGSAQISSVMDPSPTTTKKPRIGKLGFTLITTRLVNTGASQANRRRN